MVIVVFASNLAVKSILSNMMVKSLKIVEHVVDVISQQLLQSLEQYSGLDILVISTYDSESIRERIAALEARGNQVTFYQSEGGSL